MICIIFVWLQKGMDLPTARRSYAFYYKYTTNLTLLSVENEKLVGMYNVENEKPVGTFSLRQGLCTKQTRKPCQKRF